MRQIEVALQHLSQRDTLSIFNRLGVACEMLQYNLLKKIEPESSVALSTELDQFLATVYDSLNSALYISGSTELSSEVRTSGVTELMIDIGNSGITEESFTKAENSFAVSVDVLDYYTSRSLGAAEFVAVISTVAPDIVTECYEKISQVLRVIAEVDIIETSFVALNGTGFGISATAEIELHAYRKLSDMDDFTLGDFEDMTIYEVDYLDS